jgi:hypothetical protein
MRAFLCLEERNAKARFLDRDLLQFVEEEGLLPGAILQDLIRQGEEPAARTHGFLQVPRGETTASLLLSGDGSPKAVYVNAGHVHLPQFLFQRHAGKQFFDAPVYGGGTIRWRLGWQAANDCEDGEQEKNGSHTLCTITVGVATAPAKYRFIPVLV